MKRTPAIEASLVYGISLVLSFLFFLLSFGLTKAVTLSQMVAILLLMPTWAIIAVVSYLQGRKTKSPVTKYGKFFANITIISILAILAAILVALLPAGVKSQANVISSMNLAIANYFISTAVASAVTHLWIYRKPEGKPTYAPVNPSLVRSTKRSTKKKK
jgi:phosphatidylglycerophosphate synthase